MPVNHFLIENCTKWKVINMLSYEKQIQQLLFEVQKLHDIHEVSKNRDPAFFEPNMLEYPEEYDGYYNEINGDIILHFDSRGTRYDGRTEQIESMIQGDFIQVVRDKDNPFNPNNFSLLTRRGKDIGNMPSELCNAIAPLYDDGLLIIDKAIASSVKPISKRNRHAKQAMLFVEMHAVLLKNNCLVHGDTSLLSKNSKQPTDLPEDIPF